MYVCIKRELDRKYFNPNRSVLIMCNIYTNAFKRCSYCILLRDSKIPMMG